MSYFFRPFVWIMPKVHIVITKFNMQIQQKQGWENSYSFKKWLLQAIWSFTVNLLTCSLREHKSSLKYRDSYPNKKLLACSYITGHKVENYPWYTKFSFPIITTWSRNFFSQGVNYKIIFIFLSAICLPHEQHWTIIGGKFHLSDFNLHF